MPSHAHREKRVRQSLRRQRLNRWHKMRIKNATKDVRSAVEKKEESTAQTELVRVNSFLDKAAKRGTIHPRTAARKMSRLARAVNAMKADQSA